LGGKTRHKKRIAQKLWGGKSPKHVRVSTCKRVPGLAAHRVYTQLKRPGVNLGKRGGNGVGQGGDIEKPGVYLLFAGVGGGITKLDTPKTEN